MQSEYHLGIFFVFLLFSKKKNTMLFIFFDIECILLKIKAKQIVGLNNRKR